MVENNTIPFLVYLGANARIEHIRNILDICPNTLFVSSSLFPETIPELQNFNEYRIRNLIFDSSISGPNGKIKLIPENDFNDLEIIKEVISDVNIPLLWTRFKKNVRTKNQSEVKRFEVVYSLIKCAIKFLKNNAPQKIIFSYEPHMLPIYIFKKTAQVMGFDCYTMTISPFIWRLFCLQETDNEIKVMDYTNDDDHNAREKSIHLMIEEKQGHYITAKPFYEKRYEVNGLRNISILKNMYTNNWNIFRVVACSKSKREYEKLISSRNEYAGRKYVCFFLQYQPEQTTLPEGGLFVHQLFALQLLYSAVSSLGMELVVREHPATFKSTFDPKWRHEGFFEDIKKMGTGIHLDDIEQDPFALIEGASAVSAITGSVLLEGMLRGKPAIAFGSHPLWMNESTALVSNFNNESLLREQLETALDLDSDQIVLDTINYLIQVYKKSFGLEVYPGNSEMTLEKLRYARYKALLQIMQRMIQ